MAREIPLGRIAGVKVTMSPLVLVVVAVATFTLGSSTFPDAYPDLAAGAHWGAGAGLALLFLVSLLVHEMGHALVARDEGIGVRGISLWLLGGVAKMESAPTTARSEFRIAVVGPLGSAACGVVFLAGAYTLPDTGYAQLAGSVLQYLGVINLFLAGFNLLPAAPLDGGTVLSALIWKRTGSQATGMTWAARAGIVAGVVLVGYAIGDIRSDDVNTNTASLLLVGGFVLYSAIRGLQAAPMYRLLDGVTVAEAMRAAPPVAASWITVPDFLRTLSPDTAHQAYPVLDETGRVTGLLTLSAVRAVPEPQRSALRVADLAYPLDRITVVGPTEPLLPAVQKIDGGDVRDGLVVDRDGTVVGTIDAAALFAGLERRKAELAASPTG